jgi:tol-pal system protein YbgF
VSHRHPGSVPCLCLLAVAATLSACATGSDLRETSKKFEGQTSSLDSKIEQLKRTQSEADKNLAKLQQLLEENKREQTRIGELAAKLNSDVRGFREMDLTKVEGRIERAKRDIEALQGKVEDQVSSLQQNAQQWLATLDQKQSAKLDQQVTKVDQQVAKVEARLEGLDKREAVASRRIEETLTTLGKKIDERHAEQDRRVEARIKKVDDEWRAVTAKLTAHLAEVDKSLAHMSDTVKTVGAKLSTQLEQQGASLGKVEEAAKQGDGQLRTLAPRVDQIKSSLGELAKVLHTLTEKSSDLDRRVTELGGQTEGKVGVLAVQGGEQSARLEKLAKRLEIENQAMSGHLNTVTQSVNTLAKSLEGVQGRVAELQGRVGDVATRGQDDTQGVRIDALTRGLTETMNTVNDTTRAIGDLKNVLDTSLGKLATRVDEQGDALNKIARQLGVRTVGTPQDANQPESQAGVNGAAKPNVPTIGSPIVAPDGSAESAYEKSYQEFQQNRHENALALFQQFLSQYPDSSLVPNAHFWIAECYVKKRDYPKSLTSYEQVIRNYPKSGKASISLYRKALVLLELNDKPAAKTALKRLITDYPRSEESKQARIKLGSLQ